MDRSIRTSAKARVFRDGCMLAVRLRDQDGEFYIMPGGGQMPGELLPRAAEREPHHRVDIVFLCEYLGEGGDVSHPDSNQTGYVWLPIEGLNRTPLYPSKLRRPIMDLFAGKPAPVYLGNENAGDPEVTD